MPDIRQLSKVLEIRDKAEKNAVSQLAKARQNLTQQSQQLKTLNDYRSDYLSQITEQGHCTVNAQYFQSLQEFVARLDDAMGRSRESVDIAQRVVEQRTEIWRKARTERRAVELLIGKEQTRQAQQRSQREQGNMDELAVNKFIRSERVMS